VRGGHILPMQTPGQSSFGVGQTTAQSRLSGFRFVAALDSTLNASGEIFVDDGESFYSLMYGNYVHTKFLLWCDEWETNSHEYTCVFENQILHQGYDGITDNNIDSVVIYGFNDKYFMPDVDLTNATMNIQFVGNMTDVEFSFDSKYGTLTLSFAGNMTANPSVSESFFIAWTMSASGGHSGGGGGGGGDGGNGDDGNGGNSDHVSGGAIAGIVIGAVLGSVLIFCLVCYLFRQKQSHQHGDYVPVEELHPL